MGWDRRTRKIVVVITGAIQIPLSIFLGYNMAMGNALISALLTAALFINQYFHEAYKEYWMREGGEAE